MSSEDVQKLCLRILERLDKLEMAVGEMATNVKNLGKVPALKKIAGDDMFLRVPHHLRRTLMVMYEVGEGTATEIFPKTGRTRGLESIYLNQLSRMGMVEKIRRGRKVHFRLKRYL